MDQRQGPTARSVTMRMVIDRLDQMMIESGGERPMAVLVL
jgi:hypothetical protein